MEIKKIEATYKVTFSDGSEKEFGLADVFDGLKEHITLDYIKEMYGIAIFKPLQRHLPRAI